MARRTIEERLAELREREARLRREQERLKARLSVEERKRDTRRRILLGSLVLARLESEPALRAIVERELAGFLTRPGDRELFAGIVGLAGVLPSQAEVAAADDATRPLRAGSAGRPADGPGPAAGSG